MNKKILLLTFMLFSCSTSSLIPSTSINTSINSTLTSDIDTTTNESINNTTSSTTSQNKKKIKIYINPSVQTGNIYYDKVTTEAKMMNKVSDKIYEELKDDTRYEIYRNDRYLPLSESVKESNKLKVDYHLALHTNAGGGTGSEAYYYGNSYFANHVLNSFNKYHTFKNRGIKNGGHLFELKNSNAKNKALIEFLFHDNKTESDYIIKNYVILAISMIEAIQNLVNQ